jgi:hypothetical protein
MIAFGGAFAAAVRGIHHEYHRGTLFIEPYWINFYLTNYQDGFRRRAFVGTAFRFLFPRGADVRWINLSAMLTVIALVLLLLYAFLRICPRTSDRSAIFAFALFGSSVVSVGFEVLGDTLQIALLLFMVAALVADRLKRNDHLRIWILLTALGVAFLVHEASIFFLAPSIPFILHRRPRPRDFLVPTLVALGLLALSAHWSATNARLSYQVLLYPRKPQLTEPVGTPGFTSLMQTEFAWNFGDESKILVFADRCFGALLMMTASLIALASCMTKETLKRTLHFLFWIALYAVPLWVMAHDWGRFLSYNLILAIFVTLFAKQDDVDSLSISRLGCHVERFADKTLALSRFEPVQIAIIFLLLVSPFEHNRDLVVRVADTQSCLGILGVAFFLYRRKSGVDWHAEPIPNAPVR